MNLLLPIFRCLSPPGRRGRLSTLIFHRVLPELDPLFPDLPDAARFDEILRWLKSWFNVMPLDQAVRQLAAGTLPSRAAAITFDDGYADNFSVALPLLQKHELTATFFITTGPLNGGCMWNDTVIEAIRHCPRTTLDLEGIDLGRHALDIPSDRRIAIDALLDRLKYLPDSQRSALADRIATEAAVSPSTTLMMTSDNLKQMQNAGMQIGAHTVSHPILVNLTFEEARREIAESKSQLEQILAERVGLFAYPNGKLGEDYGDEHAALARSIGFDAALSTNWGAAAVDSDLMQLPRFTPWDRGRLRFGARLAANLVRAPSARI